MTIKPFYASAPVGVIELRLLEIAHSTFAAPLRLYTPGYDDLTVTLENSSTATFKACAFRTTRPAADDSGRVSRSLQIDGVDGSINADLMKAVQSDVPIVCTVRVYLSTDLSAPQFNPPEVLSLSGITISKTQISATAENEDVLNKRFPNSIYTTDNTPGLKR